MSTTIDSADGFERSAENARSPRFQQMFGEFARERRDIVQNLQDHVRRSGGTPNDDGSLTAGVHRGWEDLKVAVSGGDDKNVVDEVERGEDYIKGKYESALSDRELSPECRTLVEQAFQSVRRGHDRASQLKHSMQATG